MKSAQCEPYTVEVCMACDNRMQAVQTCREFCDEVGLCVTVVDADYIYTGGAESGIIVRLINYPRFPDSQENIYDKAYRLALRLKSDLRQKSFSLLTPTHHYWESDDAP